MKVQTKHVLDRFAALRLRAWLGLMAAAELLGLTDTPLYYWLVRRAAGCHRWRS